MIPYNSIAKYSYLCVFFLGISSGLISYIPVEDVSLRVRGTVVGEVMDENATGIPDAIVTLENIETRTNEEGWYIIENVEEGEYQITATHEGYEGLRKSVKVNGGRITKVNFVLRHGEGMSLEESKKLENTDMKLNIGGIFIIFGICAGMNVLLIHFKKGEIFSIVLGSLSILSFGFYIGSILSVVGLSALIMSKKIEKKSLERVVKKRVVHTKEKLTTEEVFGHTSKPSTQITAKSPTMEETVEPIIVDEIDTKKILCRICVEPVRDNHYVCSCGKIYHRSCVSSKKKCLHCNAIIPPP